MANKAELQEMRAKVLQINNSMDQCLVIIREYIKGELFGKMENGKMNNLDHAKTTRKYEVLKNLISIQKNH